MAQWCADSHRLTRMHPLEEPDATDHVADVTVETEIANLQQGGAAAHETHTPARCCSHALLPHPVAWRVLKASLKCPA